MKVLLGCTTESSCGISAAAQLAPLADWVDLDDALLSKNDPFSGVRIVDGSVALSDEPGIGATAIGT
jgi:L-alanine-DL-glutamate epimerase-like enolase superfamily enzyme